MSWDEASLAELGLSTEVIGGLEEPDKMDMETPEPQRREQLLASLVATRAEYAAELTAMEDEARRVAARKRDYSLAIHVWVKRLAERGVLMELHDETSTGL
jgi:hypothetical protein